MFFFLQPLEPLGFFCISLDPCLNMLTFVFPIIFSWKLSFDKSSTMMLTFVWPFWLCLYIFFLFICRFGIFFIFFISCLYILQPLFSWIYIKYGVYRYGGIWFLRKVRPFYASLLLSHSQICCIWSSGYSLWVANYSTAFHFNQAKIWLLFFE